MITLITDFGTADYFVGAIKGVLLSIDETARIVDITHDIPAHDIEAGAFVLFGAYRTFPPQTIHLAIVDPGVGSDRRPILVKSDDYWFVGPDNGIFSYVYERETNYRVFHLTNEQYFHHPVSSTFHGRDIFAAVAGALLKGVEPEALGHEITDYKRLEPLALVVSDAGRVKARIIHVDRFGNCITNITRDVLTDELILSGVSLRIGDHAIDKFLGFFAEEDGSSSEVFAIWGSTGFLEIAAFRRSAAELLEARCGHEVIVNIP